VAFEDVTGVVVVDLTKWQIPACLHILIEKGELFMSDCNCSDQNHGKHNKKGCDCCCVPGIKKILQELKGEVITVFNRIGQAITGRVKKVNCDILILEVEAPTPTFYIISLCEIITISFSTPPPCPTDVMEESSSSED
jgi:hypothetical protein